jgi:uncharacterized Ntn-hydrolase superfamily protein
MLDLRVDDHPQPIGELRRLLDLHRLYFERPDPDRAISVDPPLRNELRSILAGRGFTPDDDFGRALFDYLGWENLEERWLDADRIDPAVLAYIREHEGNR